MTPLEVVEAYFRAVNAGDVDTSQQLLADDFQSISVRGVLGKAALVNVLRILATAMPDFHCTLSDVEVNENRVTVTENVRGTHTGVLDLSIMNAQTFAPTGKSIDFVMARVEFTVEGDHITQGRDVLTPAPDVGLPGLLKAIGAV